MSGRLLTVRFVYFAYNPRTSMVKIGSSSDPLTRTQALGKRLQLLKMIRGSYKRERLIHRTFAHIRRRGEWFADCQELRDYIKKCPGIKPKEYGVHVGSRITVKLMKELRKIADQKYWTISRVVLRALEAYVKREANA